MNDMIHIPAWGVWALLSALLFSIANLLDKTILYRYKLTPLVYFTLDAFAGIFPILIVIIGYREALDISPEARALAFYSGVALAVFNILYFYALQTSDVAVVVIILQTTPFFSLFWGIVLLSEHYDLQSYSGMFLIIVGAAIASISEKKDGSFHQAIRTKTFLASVLMFAAAFILSITYLVTDIAVKEASIIAVFFWQRVCLVLISVIFVIIQRKELRKLSLAPIALTSLVEIVVIIGLLFITAAFSSGPLAGVTFLGSLQPLWVLLIAWFLHAFTSNRFLSSDNISKRSLIISCCLVILGLYLMGFSGN